MKKYFLSAAVALTATVALAASINIAKVNATISDILKQEVTEFIPHLEIVFAEDTNVNIDDLGNTVVGVQVSAEAKESKWSDAATSLDLALRIKNLELKEENSRLQFKGTLGSRTEAVALYRYLGQSMAQDEANAQTDLDKEFLEWAKTAAKTESLAQIAPQLETLVVLIKKDLLEENQDGGYDMKKWAELMDSLVVDTMIQNYQTVGVVLKTTKKVKFSDVSVSALALTITEDGITFVADVSTDVDNGYVEMITGMIGNYLSAIENADGETLEDLRDMARSYIQLAEHLLKKN